MLEGVGVDMGEIYSFEISNLVLPLGGNYFVTLYGLTVLSRAFYSIGPSIQS